MYLRHRLHSPLRDQAGIILPLVLVFLALGLLLITPTLGHGYTALAGSSIVENKAGEIHAADSGVEEGLYWLINGKKQDNQYVLADGATEWFDGPWVRSPNYELNGKTVSVTVTKTTGESEYLYCITARAEDASGGSTTVCAQVNAVPFVEFDYYNGNQNITSNLEGNIFIDGDLSVGTGNTTITGDVVVTGSLDLGQGATIVGDVYSTGDATLGQSSNVNCSVLCTEGDLILENSSEILPPINVTAEIHFLDPAGSTMTLANQADITGNIFSWGDLVINMNNPQNVITGNILADGDLTIDMSATNAKGTINGNLYATGLITVKMGSSQSDVNGTAYYYPDAPGGYVEIGASGAGWPAEYICGVTGPCTNWPTPQHDCPGPSRPEILSWEIS